MDDHERCNANIFDVMIRQTTYRSFRQEIPILIAAGSIEFVI